MADEPERRIIGAILAELEEQARSLFLNVDVPDAMNRVQITGRVNLDKLAKAILKETQSPKKPRLIEYDLPVRQTADLEEEAPLALWEVPMKPRNLPRADIVFVKVEANSAEEAISKALSSTPGHYWGTPKQIGTTHP